MPLALALATSPDRAGLAKYASRRDYEHMNVECKHITRPTNVGKVNSLRLTKQSDAASIRGRSRVVPAIFRKRKTWTKRPTSLGHRATRRELTEIRRARSWDARSIRNVSLVCSKCIARI